MYWIVAADTVGDPRRIRALEWHEWRGTAAEPLVVVRQTTLGFERETQLDTFIAKRLRKGEKPAGSG